MPENTFSMAAANLALIFADSASVLLGMRIGGMGGDA